MHPTGVWETERDCAVGSMATFLKFEMSPRLRFFKTYVVCHSIKLEWQLALWLEASLPLNAEQNILRVPVTCGQGQVC